MTDEAPQGVPKPPFKFNLRQSKIETARGTLISAANDYGDTSTGIRLRQLVQALTVLRDPPVVEHFERIEQRKAKAQPRQREATNG